MRATKRPRETGAGRVGDFQACRPEVSELSVELAGLILSDDRVHVGGEQESALLATKFSLPDTIPIHVTQGLKVTRSLGPTANLYV